MANSVLGKSERKRKPNMDKRHFLVLSDMQDDHNSSECPSQFPSFYSFCYLLIIFYKGETDLVLFSKIHLQVQSQNLYYKWEDKSNAPFLFYVQRKEYLQLTIRRIPLVLQNCSIIQSIVQPPLKTIAKSTKKKLPICASTGVKVSLNFTAIFI